MHRFKLSFEEAFYLSSTIQSIVFSVALIIGGYWAYYKFVSLESGSQISLSVAVSLDIVYSEGEKYIVIAALELHNSGKKVITINISGSRINMVRIEEKEGLFSNESYDGLALAYIDRNKKVLLDTQEVQPNSTKRVPLLFYVDRACA